PRTVTIFAIFVVTARTARAVVVTCRAVVVTRGRESPWPSIVRRISVDNRSNSCYGAHKGRSDDC
ncbi:hypothetical protein CVT26_000267, partial [Gymnopilus dilepis]